jgi:hypothetical protein
VFVVTSASVFLYFVQVFMIRRGGVYSQETHLYSSYNSKLSLIFTRIHPYKKSTQGICYGTTTVFFLFFFSFNCYFTVEEHRGPRGMGPESTSQNFQGIKK